MATLVCLSEPTECEYCGQMIEADQLNTYETSAGYFHDRCWEDDDDRYEEDEG